MLSVIDLPTDSTPSDIAQAFLEAWPSSRVVHIKGVRPRGDLREFYGQFFDKVGEPARLAEDATKAREEQRTGEVWFEVRYDPSIPNAYRHSANPQPLHTDGSYIAGFPNAGFLSCQAMAGQGGATTFIDGPVLVDILKRKAPALLQRLEQISMPHARSGDRRDAPVVRYENNEPVLNWNYYCVDPAVPDHVKKLRQEFFDFLANEPEIQTKTIPVKMAPGEAIVWKDDRTLHGRQGFDAREKSERFLWKAALQVTT
jgi:alpha-ketoglutarate-dependent taurine dioxygenase